MPGAIPPALPASTVPPLSPEHLEQLKEARISARKVFRAITVARADAWTMAVLGGLTFIFGLGSVSGLVMGLGLGAVALVEFRASARLRRLDPLACRTLGINQVAIALLLIGYSVSRLIAEATGGGAYAEMTAGDPQLRELLQPDEQLTRLVSSAVYVSLIAVAIFAQGGLALYYFTRAKYVRAHLLRTPGWILSLQKAGMSL